MKMAKSAIPKANLCTATAIKFHMVRWLDVMVKTVRENGFTYLVRDWQLCLEENGTVTSVKLRRTGNDGLFTIYRYLYDHMKVN